MTKGTLLLSALVLGLGGCKKKAPPPPAPAALAPSEPDRLQPEQLLEGDQKVFHLALPVSSTIEAIFRESVSVRGEYAPEDLAAYLKSRLRSGHVEMAGDKIVFPKAQVRGGDERLFRVEIGPLRGGAQLRMRDITPAPADPNLTEEERWRQVGMTPDGRLLDPHNLK